MALKNNKENWRSQFQDHINIYGIGFHLPIQLPCVVENSNSKTKSTTRAINGNSKTKSTHGNSKAKSTTGAINGFVLDSMTWKTTTHDMSWTARENNLSMSRNLDTVRLRYTGNTSYATRTGCRLVHVAKKTTTTPCIQDTISRQLCVTSNRITL